MANDSSHQLGKRNINRLHYSGLQKTSVIAWSLLVLNMLMFTLSPSAAEASSGGPSAIPIWTPGGMTVQRSLGPQPSAASSSGLPVGLQNGQFDMALDGWTVSQSGGTSTPGMVQSLANDAVLLEGDSFLVTLEQTFILPSFATELIFQLTLDPGFDSGASFIPDAFEASLLDSNLLPVIDPWTLGATSAFNLQEDLTASMGSDSTWDPITGIITLDVSNVPVGTIVTLYFDFIGADADELGGITIDNVSLVTTPPVGSFIRGDVDNNGVLDSTDELTLLDRILGGNVDALDCTGSPLLEVFDSNDNEVLTIADYLRSRNSISTGSMLPAPSLYCDFDPTNDLGGFDLIDSAYKIAPGDLVVQPLTGVVDRDLFVPILIESPLPVTAVTFIFQFNASVLTPFDPIIDGETLDSTLGNVSTRIEGNQIIATIWASNDGDHLLAGAPGQLQELGQLRFQLADFATIPPLSFESESAGGASVVRTTIVDAAFADHQPELLAGSGLFVRGDVNNDSLIDVSDAVFTLNYLFIAGESPGCFDAVDINNDGQLNIADPVYLLEFLFLAGSPIPAPSPGCGFDAGAIDSLDCVESLCQ